MATALTPYSIPQEPGRWRAIALAVMMHALLFAFLWGGIRWQSQQPAVIEAEVWNLDMKEAAPRPQPQAEPMPKIASPPKPEPKPEPKIEKEIAPPKPDIALEREKQRKEKLRQQQETEDRKKAEDEQKKAEALAKKKAQAEIKRKQAAEAAEAEQIAKLRDEEMRRINSGTGGTGDAQKAQGIPGDPSYAAKIRQKIRSNTVFIVPADLSGNPTVEYEIKLFPDGTLSGPPRKKKSSGVPGFDEAVARAIDLSQPFPKDKNGHVPSSLIIAHQPKDN